MAIIQSQEAFCNFLEKNNADYEILKHKAASTSKESAIFRNSPEGAGAKALVIITKHKLLNMLVLPGNKKLDNKLAKQKMMVKSFRFLTSDELLETTGLKAGEVPPFGSLYGLTTFCDQQLLTNEYLYFNICSRTDSVKLKTSDYLRIEQPKVHEFSL